MACIAGGIAEAYWGVPDKIARRALAYLDGQLGGVVADFGRRFGASKQNGNV
jgi:ADP-ribosylglycohydrolase